jgi:hypothetical protein
MDSTRCILNLLGLPIWDGKELDCRPYSEMLILTRVNMYGRSEKILRES